MKAKKKWMFLGLTVLIVNTIFINIVLIKFKNRKK